MRKLLSPPGGRERGKENLRPGTPAPEGSKIAVLKKALNAVWFGAGHDESWIIEKEQQDSGNDVHEYVDKSIMFARRKSEKLGSARIPTPA